MFCSPEHTAAGTAEMEDGVERMTYRLWRGSAKTYATSQPRISTASQRR
jgi:hypothetical protein